jgi:very-short-patch-repair endonuclease
MAKPSLKLQFARQMRKEPVSTEEMLWKRLRDRRLDGLKFRRQVPIGRYIADFVCLRHRLIVEADGPHHENSLTDIERDAWLASQGFRVLRFTNAQIWNGWEETLVLILKAAGRDI